MIMPIYPILSGCVIKPLIVTKRAESAYLIVYFNRWRVLIVYRRIDMSYHTIIKHAGVQFLESCPDLTGSTRAGNKILSNNRDNIKIVMLI